MKNGWGKFVTSPHFVKVETSNGAYAYNSLFGGFKKLSIKENVVLAKIANGQLDNISDTDEILKDLHARHFISNTSGIDEGEILSALVDKYESKVKSGSSITKLLLHVTQKCMLACAYCYIPDAPYANSKCSDSVSGCISEEASEDMSWDTAKASIDAFYEIIKQNGQASIHIRFHGGEPLIMFDLIKKSINYADELFKTHKLTYHINTNGVLMTDEMAAFFSSHKVHIEVSIDGTREIHDKVRPYKNGLGSFDSAIDAINKLLKAKFSLSRLNFAVTLNDANINSLTEIIDLAANAGIREVEINTLLFEHPMDILDRVDERVDKLIQARIYGVKRSVKVSGKWFKLFERLYNPVLNYCGRMGQQIGVDSHGDVFLCTGYLKRFGGIKEWEKIIKRDDYIDISMRVVGRIKECRDCMLEGLCAGGCVASVVKSYQSFDCAERKECEFRKKIVAGLIENIERINGNGVCIEEVDSSYVPTIVSNID